MHRYHLSGFLSSKSSNAANRAKPCDPRARLPRMLLTGFGSSAKGLPVVVFPVDLQDQNSVSLHLSKPWSQISQLNQRSSRVWPASPQKPRAGGLTEIICIVLDRPHSHPEGGGRSVQLLAELEELFPEVWPVIGELACDLLFAESGLAKQRWGPGETEEIGKQGRAVAVAEMGQ